MERNCRKVGGAGGAERGRCWGWEGYVRASSSEGRERVLCVELLLRVS